MTDDLAREHEDLYQRVAEIIEAARSHVARTVNTAMVHAYWRVGREIVEVEQRGQARAEYGEQVIANLAKRLSSRFGRGMGVATLRRIRSFYVTYPNGSSIPNDVSGLGIRSSPLIESDELQNRSTALIDSGTQETELFPPLLSWSHYLLLMRVQDDRARAFYEIEAARESWSVRELERQIASLLFERLAKSRDKDQILALAKQGQIVSTPKDVVKNPFVLEFLDLQERSTWLERDLEQAIIDRLESFLLELGKGFCFVSRQKRVTLEGDHFYVDLVFYNRLLRCFVLIDLLCRARHNSSYVAARVMRWTAEDFAVIRRLLPSAGDRLNIRARSRQAGVETTQGGAHEVTAWPRKPSDQGFRARAALPQPPRSRTSPEPWPSFRGRPQRRYSSSSRTHGRAMPGSC